MRNEKILHQHLIKCGGTSLNAFLDTKYYANRIHDPEAARVWFDAAFSHYKQRYGNAKELQIQGAYHRLGQYDCVHGHNPMVWAAPESFSKITVLRDPVTRTLSQIRDWKRLEDHDLRNRNPGNNNFLRFCRTASLEEIIDNYRAAQTGILNLSNMQSKLLVKSTHGVGVPEPKNDKELLEKALEAVNRFEVLGLVEDISSFYKRLCHHMAWCPPRAIEHRNRTDSRGLEVNEEDIARLRELNSVDIELYQIIADRLKAQTDSTVFDTAAFEAEFASERTKSIAPVFIGNRTFRFDFNMPIIGNGFHGRDAPNTPEAAVWTGPGNITTLFFPVLPLTPMTIQLGIKGYADASVRDSITCVVDGIEKPYALANGDNVADLLEVEHTPERTFVRVDINLPRTFSSGDDKRSRGISILNYGYKLSP